MIFHFCLKDVHEMIFKGYPRSKFKELRTYFKFYHVQSISESVHTGMFFSNLKEWNRQVKLEGLQLCFNQVLFSYLNLNIPTKVYQQFAMH